MRNERIVCKRGKRMKGTLYIVTACFILLTATGIVSATGDGKALIYGGAGQGKVIFDGREHASRGMVCSDCHTKIFETRKNARITMDDHNGDQACFVCHDGKKAFNHCGQCHRKF